MKQAGFAPLLIVVLITLALGGYFIYQKQTKPTPSPQSTIQPTSAPLPKDYTDSEKKLKIQKTPILEQTTSWKIYKNDKYGLQIKYPPDWVTKENFKTFENGDLIVFLDNTHPQRANTEYYNTGIFAIGIPLKTDKDTTSWVKDYYQDRDSRIELSEQLINGLNYQRIFICGLGCFNYYHTKVGNLLYSFSLTYFGPDEILPEYEQKLINMLYTVKFTQ